MARTSSPCRTTRPFVGLLAATCSVVLGAGGCELTEHDMPGAAPAPSDTAGTGGAGDLFDNPAYPVSPLCIEECRDTRTPLELDEPSPLGFSPEDVLALAEGAHEVTLTYDPGQKGTFHITPASTTANLTMVVERQGEAAFVESWPGPYSCYPPDSEEICPERVEVEVTVALRTDDGAFDERLPALLVAESPVVESPTEVRLTAPVDLGSLEGSFAVSAVDFEPSEATDTTLQAAFGPGIFVGSVTGLILATGDEYGTTGYVTLADWGRGDCGHDAALVDPEAEGVVSTTTLVETINLASPLPVSWADGTATELSLSVSDLDAALCRGNLRWMGPDAPEPYESYVTTGTIELATTDGRWTTTQSVVLYATTTAGRLGTLALYLADGEPIPASDFETTYGLQGIDLDDFDAAGLGLEIVYRVEDDGVAAQGDLAVVGVLPNDCVETEQSMCGAAGRQEVAVGKLGTAGEEQRGPNPEPR